MNGEKRSLHDGLESYVRRYTGVGPIVLYVQQSGIAWEYMFDQGIDP